MPGNGGGSFPTQVRYPVSWVPISVAIGDFDVDGQQDLAVANSYANSISVLLGFGDGSFGSQTLYPTGYHPGSVAVGDFNGDGRQDLAVVNTFFDSVSVLLNQVPPPLNVEIDINPGFFPNTINTGIDFLISVALFGTADFDASDVDVTTLRFGPGGAAPAHDLTDQFTYNYHLQDLNLDGFMDLMIHFPVQQTGIACGDESGTLTGNLLSGGSMEGTDSIRTVGCGGIKE
jgi:hypothetical protein